MSFDAKEARPLKPEDFALLLKWRAHNRGEASPELCGLSEAELEKLREHVLAVWAEVKRTAHVYRCVQTMTFLSPRVNLHPCYKQLLAAARAAEVEGKPFYVLDVGCGFGQDTRALVLDGIKPDGITVADVTSTYWEGGRQVFGDADGPSCLSTVRTAFGDWAAPLDTPDDIARDFQGHFNAVALMLVLHVLSKEQSDALLLRLAGVSAPGAILVGAAAGAEFGGVWAGTKAPVGEKPRWLHSAASLEASLAAAGWGVRIQIDVGQSITWSEGAAPRPETPPELGQMRYLQFAAVRGDES